MSGHQVALLMCFCGAVIAAALSLLKIHGIIQVGWLWVLSPLWTPVAICVVVYVVLLLMVFLIMNSL